MQAVDTNILVYAEIVSSVQHARARELVSRLAEGPTPWAIPWPCLYEWLRVITHPRVFHPPMPLEQARRDLHMLLSSPTLLLLGETDRHAEILERILETAGARGNLLHDAHIAALCLEHGVTELFTADRDFARFTALHVTNPFT